MADTARSSEPFSAVVLAGGRASRLDGADKAALELGGRTLLSLALEAVADAAEVVVVGDPVEGPAGNPTGSRRPLRFVREDPPYGGPVAALLAGVDALRDRPDTVAVLACDMPRVTAHTVERLREAARGRDGAVLVDPDGRRQLAMVLDTARLDAARPEPGQQDGLAVHRFLAALVLAEVAADGSEHRDVDTWSDVEDLGRNDLD